MTTIGYQAFYGCISLTSITIPDSVTEIEWEAFDGTAFYDNEDNWEGGVLYIGNHLIKAKETIAGEYKIKEGTKTIADHAFTKYTLSSSIKKYDGCKSLTSITIPDSVTVIGFEAFRDCTSLTSVIIGNGVTTIGDSAFYKCFSLTEIVIPDSVTSIGESVFEKSKVTSVTYQGTKEEWKKVEKDSNWRNSADIQKVICKDGVLTGEEIG